MFIVKFASKAVKMSQAGIQCVLCAALGLDDVVSNKQNNILKRETWPLFPVCTVMSNLDLCPGAANFCYSLGLNVHLILLAKHPNTCVKFFKHPSPRIFLFPLHNVSTLNCSSFFTQVKAEVLRPAKDYQYPS